MSNPVDIRTVRERDALARTIARGVAGGYDLAPFKRLIDEFSELDELLGDAYHDESEHLADAEPAPAPQPKGTPHEVPADRPEAVSRVRRQ
jgi:hypothetical protein